MCGIAGLVNLDGRAVAEATLRAMASSLGHRGPDEQSTWIDPGNPAAGLAFARLVVLDRAGGHQPMASTREPRRRVVFNGEIYNHRELRRELEGRGHAFVSDHSDTEVIAPLYEEAGAALVERLRGMFALAVYDGPGRRLLLARDRMGQKPLYWAATERVVAFASEAKALAAVEGLDRAIDLESLDLYLQLGYVPSPRTIWRGIRKLEPGHRIVIALDSAESALAAQPQSWWTPPAAEAADNDAPDDVLDERARAVGEAMTEAVRIRLEADVPLGFFLSGGLDSSAVLALARKAMPTGRLRTFSMAFPDARYDESEFAATMARHVGAEHTRLEAQAGSLEEELAAVVRMCDEPFADSSAVPTALLARAAREHVTVALSGDGGDEVFGGYDRYRAVRLSASLDRSEGLRRVIEEVGRLVPPGLDLKSGRSRVRRFTDALSLEPLARYARWVSPYHEPDTRAFYGAALREASDAAGDSVVAYLASRAAADRPLGEAVMQLDARTYLPEDVLMKVDRATMACGLEVRSPLVDHRVVEAAMPLADYSRLGRKWLLRRIVREMVPETTLLRRKMGFGVPLSSWLRGASAEWMRRRMSEGPLAESGLVDAAAVGTMAAEHIQEQGDHGPRLWSLLVLDEFLRTS